MGRSLRRNGDVRRRTCRRTSHVGSFSVVLSVILYLNPPSSASSDVGVSGLLLGGGLSFLSPSSGFASDRFRSLTVVLTNGDIVTATATNQYKDLFWALKGGANRFGIVTHYEVDAIQTGTALDENWYGGSIYVLIPTS